MKKLMALFLALGIMVSCAACGQDTGTPANGDTSGAVSSSLADTYPGSELRILVPYQTGGALDVQTRLVGKYLSKELDTNVVVENVTGAGGVLGVTQFLAEEANSHVILLMSDWLCTVHPLINQVEYTADDFIPIIDHNAVDFALFVRPDSGIQNLDDLKAYAEANGRILFASDGPGSATYIIQKTLYDQMGIPCETISMSGNAEGVTNLMAGTVDVAISGMNMAADYIANGDMQPLVCFAEEDIQDETAGTIPSVKGQNFDLTYQGYFYYVARSGTDAAIIDKLHDAFAAVYANPDFVAEQEVIDFKAPGRTGDEITQYVTNYTELAKSTFSLD